VRAHGAIDPVHASINFADTRSDDEEGAVRTKRVREFTERRGKIRSALIAFTAALQIHECQTIRGVRRALGETIICRAANAACVRSTKSTGTPSGSARLKYAPQSSSTTGPAFATSPHHICPMGAQVLNDDDDRDATWWWHFGRELLGPAGAGISTSQDRFVEGRVVSNRCAVEDV
jgi:hypothetical protein